MATDATIRELAAAVCAASVQRQPDTGEVRVGWCALPNTAMDALAAALAEPVAVDAGRLAWQTADRGDDLEAGPFWLAITLRDDSDQGGPWEWAVNVPGGECWEGAYAPTREAARQAAVDAATQLARAVLAALDATPEGDRP